MIVAPLVAFRSAGKLFKRPTFLYGLPATGYTLFHPASLRGDAAPVL